MKTRPWILAPSVALLLVAAACQPAHTQQAANQPQVITPPASTPAKANAPTPAPTSQPATAATPAVAMQTPPPEASAPGQKRMSYNSCNVEGPYVALTFDDGPHATLTPKLLDILKQRGIKATFYVIGQSVAAYPDVVKRAAAEGHEIGNHSWNHTALTKGGGSVIPAQVNPTNDAIVQITGKKPATLRPTYGSTNASINKRLNEEFGFKVILWDVDPLDWKIRNAAHVTNAILTHTKPGSIILSHDIHPSTIEAMPATIDGLLAKGFKFVTVSELIAMDRPQVVPTPQPAPQKASPKAKKNKG